MSELTSIWRDVSQCQQLEELVERLLPVLRTAFPLQGISFRRFDEEGRRLWTVASAPREENATVARSDLNDAQFALLQSWPSGKPARSSDEPGAHALFRALLVPGDGRPAIAIALREEDALVGIALLHARPSARFSESHLARAAELVEPFTVAFHNDRRIEELDRLRAAAEADNKALLSRLERQDITEVVGAEAGLRHVMQRVELVARTDAPVLILGETGSGKEVIARAIHARSRRASGPLLRVNCGAIPAELVDAELFGHEKGSFTGAVATRQGWFERADGGTLFLDEIGELPPAAQVRLLRVLQDGTYERVGGQRTLTADVRIIAATHRDLEAMVQSGAFRQDLWFRLSVFPVHLPPLRERLEDLPELVEHLAARAGRRLAGVPLSPTPADIELLRRYDWPGNVRELAAVIERAAILGDGRRLEVGLALGMNAADLRPQARGSAAPVAVPSAPANVSRTSEITLQDAMRLHIEKALIRAQGRIEGPYGAAALLNINPHTLRSRMRKLGIEWSAFRPAPFVVPPRNEEEP